MSIKNPFRWVRTISGQSVGFLYEPGSALKAFGIKPEHFTLSGSWTHMRQDAANVALNKFGTDLEVASKSPKEVT